jgi:hypothetical protein
MDADFEGAMHDLDAPRQEEGSDEEEGDEDRIDQQMGEVRGAGGAGGAAAAAAAAAAPAAAAAAVAA